MNAKTEAAVIKHGEQLLQVFTQATEKNPLLLCRKLRRLENLAGAIALRLCNGPEYRTEDEADNRCNSILEKVDTLLNFKASGVPVFVNRDPRGYALKVTEEWQRAQVATGKPYLYGDWGGYGIIAPDLTENK